MRILGVEIDNLSRADILIRVEKFLIEPKFHQIATVNPEFLVEADRNPEFQKVLNDCDLRVADGFGISLVAFLRGVKWKCRFPGVDLMEEILRMANELHLSVYLAIRASGLSSYEEVRSAILKRFPHIKIGGAHISEYKVSGMKYEVSDAAIVLCNFGAPYQELFLAGIKSQETKCRLAIGIGGSFDYLTGKRKRAPKWLRVLGFEWLWRVIRQPSRIRRIWNAVIVFPVRVFWK